MNNSDKIIWSRSEKLLELPTDQKILTFCGLVSFEIWFMKYAADEQNKYQINFGMPHHFQYSSSFLLSRVRSWKECLICFYWIRYHNKQFHLDKCSSISGHRYICILPTLNLIKSNLRTWWRVKMAVPKMAVRVGGQHDVRWHAGWRQMLMMAGAAVGINMYYT